MSCVGNKKLQITIYNKRQLCIIQRMKTTKHTSDAVKTKPEVIVEGSFADILPAVIVRFVERELDARQREQHGQDGKQGNPKRKAAG